MTRSALADYDADAEQAREQQIEDLQRFGVLGGDGVSAGYVADILGGFDADVLRGRASTRSESMGNVLQNVLGPAADFSTATGGLDIQQQALDQAGQQFAESLGVAGQQLSQQDRQFVDELAQLSTQFNREADLADRQFDERDLIAIAIQAREAGLDLGSFDVKLRIQELLGIENTTDDPEGQATGLTDAQQAEFAALVASGVNPVNARMVVTR